VAVAVDKQFNESEKALFSSAEGVAALTILLPLIRELAMHIAERAPCPTLLREIPSLKFPIAIERAHYRYLRQQGVIRD
jgi:hypothetical protein